MAQPIPSTPPVFTQTPVEPAPPKKSSKWLMIAVITLLLTATSVFAYKYFQVKQQLTQTQPLPMPTPSAAASPIAAPTANWKTYTNTELDFSITLPDGWKDKYLVVIDRNKVTFNYKAVQEDPYPLFWITRVTVSEWNQLQKDAMVAGLAKKILANDTFVFFSAHSLDVPYTNSVNIQNYGKMFEDINQVLSTFKFTDSADQIPAKTDCQDPRPAVCTMECIQNPPYICGSDGNSYCSACQACANQNVAWYEMKSSACGE